ncbi:hypothetical protein MANES_05G086372v8 [Manihot esculenta]|uniref:Uncharacterized protein n=1 Tax=Manihot esculenta TaxID=3983 RepID=A0ACB7HSZ3_MANES|nr:hypothetical protein MANES_05G086372v8 [Manihot esculenta]
MANMCPRKNAWPKLVRKNRDSAVSIIEKENKNVNTIVLKDGMSVTKDFRCNRVWI